MLSTVLLCVAGALILGLVIFICIWKIRTRHFKPTKDKERQQAELNQDLMDAGFAYDRKKDIFYSHMDCWQREMGYCQLFDEDSTEFNMIMHCEPFRFSYAGKRWLIELWKGQYGITTGAEIGIYNTTAEDVHTEKFTGTFYDCASDTERLPLSFVLRKNGRVLFKRSAVHWWLTGFKLGEFSHLDSLTMDAKIKFPNSTMRNAFMDALIENGYQRHEYSARMNTVTIHFTAPHSHQPASRHSVQEAVAQTENMSNCGLYNKFTGKYTDTLDKLEYLKASFPEIYEFCMHSLYARGFYDAFAWLIELIHGHQPVPPKPYPPEPCLPNPCPPYSCPPPCPPCSCQADPCCNGYCYPDPCASNNCFNGCPCSNPNTQDNDSCCCTEESGNCQSCTGR